MKERRIVAILFIVPTILWALVAYIFYKALISELMLPTDMNEFLVTTPVWQIAMVVFIGYFLSVTIGIVYYAEMMYWNRI